MNKQPKLLGLFIGIQFLFLSTFASILLLKVLGAFAQLKFPSSYVQLQSSGITFYFEFNDSNQTILMGLDMAATVDYYAVGFAGPGNTGMKVFDIVAFVFVPNTASNTYTVQIMDLYSTANAQPPQDVNLGGTSDYHLIDSYVVPGRTQVLFQRAYNTGDKFDYTFNPNVTKNSIVMNWAFNHVNRYYLTDHHNNAGTVMTPLYNGYTGSANGYSNTFISPQVVITLHSYFMIVCWGILIEIAIQIGRYHKSLNYYFVSHVWLTSIIYFLTALSSGFALYVNWGQVGGTLPNFHMYIGYVTLAFSTLQTVLGSIFRMKILEDKLTKALPDLSKGHIYLGLFIYLLTKAQLGIGLYLFKPAYMHYFYVYIAFVIVSRVCQELWHRNQRDLTGKHMPAVKGSDSNLESHQKLMSLLNTNSKFI